MNGKWKESLKKAFAMSTAAVLAGMLAVGCGQSKGAATTAQKEFVYVPEFQSLGEEAGYIDQVTVTGDTVYYISGEYDEKTQTSTSYLCSLKVGETEPARTPIDLGEDTGISRMFAAPDGSLQVILFTYLYEEPADIEEKDGEDSAADKKETADGEGTDKKEEAADEDTNKEEAAAGDSESTASGGAATTIIQEDSGSISITSSSGGTEIFSADEDYREPTSQKIELATLSADGKLSSPVDISDVFGDNGNPYVQFAELDKDGNIYLSSDQSVIVLDGSGKKLFELQTDNWINSMFSTKSGTVMVVYYGAEKMECHPIDFAKKEFGEADTNMMVSDYGNYTFVKGKETEILFSADNKLYSYNPGDEAPAEILNWIDCDVNSNDLRAFAVLEDGRILALTASWDGEENKTELIYLTKKKGSEVPEKKILTYGTMSIGYDMQKQVIEFNKTSQEYRIEVKEYMGNDSDWQTGLTQMNTDIVGGNCPDIIEFSFGNMKKYQVKGLLEDLYPYMDSDPEINREDYLPNVLKAYEMEGKLYGITPKFYVQTVIAKTADVGGRKSITMEELMKLVDRQPEGTALYPFATRDMILMYNTVANMDRFVDWTTGKCDFAGEEFIKVLEFASRFPAEIKPSEQEAGTPSRLHDGTLLMVDTSISSVQEYQMMEGMFGEPITVIGYPTDKENGSFFSDAGGTLGLSSKSKYKDGAWQFIRTGITKEAQEDTEKNSWGFPVMKSALEKQFESDMTDEYYELPDGTKEKQPKTSWGFDSFNMDIYAATKEQVDTVRTLLESVDTLYQYDEEINNIMTEETKAFFEGQKTAKDVAEIIQNRVQVYVNENR